MREINYHGILDMLNAAYSVYNPESAGEPFQDRVLSFSNVLSEDYGIKLNMLPKLDDQGRHGYSIQQAFVIDERKYTWLNYGDKVSAQD